MPDLAFNPNAFEVIVERAKCPPGEAREYIKTNCTRGLYELDWTHGEARSDPAEARRQFRYVFSDKQDAAVFRLRFG